MTKEGNKRWPHLPSEKILNERYPAGKRDPNKNIAYRRFWIGFKVKSNETDSVIYESLVSENGADKPLNLSEVLHNCYAFDSAPAEIDRNPMLISSEGICAETGHRVFGFKRIIKLIKSTESTKYYQESSDQILKIAKENNINSGGGVHDWTGRPAHPELLQQKGFHVHKLTYGKRIPDGRQRDSQTGRIERAIKLDISPMGLEFKNDIPPDKTYAHQVAEDQISLGAWALREYIKAGRVRGINQVLLDSMGSDRSIEEELYNRKFHLKRSAIYGERFKLQSKIDFKAMFKFSPDILDVLFQTAWYMLMVRKFPLTTAGEDDTVENNQPSEKTIHEDLNELWEMDGAYEEYV
jgi:hypothetical protein